MMSPIELGVVGFIVVLLFGVKRLPELGSGMGQAISNFRRSYREGNAIDISSSTEEDASEVKKEGEGKAEEK